MTTNINAIEGIEEFRKDFLKFLHEDMRKIQDLEKAVSEYISGKSYEQLNKKYLLMGPRFLGIIINELGKDKKQSPLAY